MDFPVDAATERLIRNLPKTETHLHIEGALPYELLHSVAPEAYPKPPDAWLKEYRYSSFAAFESDLLRAAGHWFTSPERYHDAAVKVFDGLQYKQNVHYVETSFASGMMQFHGIDGRATAEAIKTAAPKGMQVRVFMGIHHDGYSTETRPWIDDALSWPALDGLDLHGTERVTLGPWAADLWQRARAAGKATKAHAGEFCGPSFVRRVVEELGVRRVQHGVRSIEDPALMAELREKDVTLDVCPISNVKLGVVESYDAHPVARLLQAGVRCTLSTDDPYIFGNTLFDEYAMLSVHLGVGHEQLVKVARAGFEVALVTDSERRNWLRDFDRIASDLLPGRSPLRRV
jgi:adenine deaminase